MNTSEWDVAHYERNDPGNPRSDYILVDVPQPSEAVARKVFADTVRTARVHGYRSVMLRKNDVVLEGWP